MTAAQEDLVRANRPSEFITVDSPRVEDGAAIWRIARDSGVLDLNSSYSYLLWCRDFAATSLVARDPEGAPIAFVTGYTRPGRPGTLVVWQIAVDAAHRGQGLAGVLLDALTARVTHGLAVREVETTVTPDNTASDRLFTAYARRHGARLEREVLFDAGLFPPETDPAVETAPAVNGETGVDTATGAGSETGVGSRTAPAAGGEAAEPHQPEILYRIGPLSPLPAAVA